MSPIATCIHSHSSRAVWSTFWSPILGSHVPYVMPWRKSRMCLTPSPRLGKLPGGLEAVRRTSRMAARIDYDWPDRDPKDDSATRTTLQDIRDSCRRLHEDIEATYFDYEIEDTPGP